MFTQKMSIRLFFSLFLLFFFTATQAHAHEFIVKPLKTKVVAQESIAIELQAAHVFMVSEEVEVIADVSLEVLQNGKRSPLAVTDISEKLALTSNWTPESAASALLIGHRKVQIWSDTTDGVLAGTRKELEAKGMRVLSEGRYEKFAKAVIPGSTANAAVSEPVGQLLEIVPAVDLNDVTPGTALTMQLFYAGKPLADCIVAASYDGFSSEGDTYAIFTKTDDAGKFIITPDSSGLWMVRANYEKPLSTPPQSSSHTSRSVLVFVVQ